MIPLRLFHRILFMLGTAAIIRCSPTYQPYTGEARFSAPDGQPNYENLQYWAAHPSKPDPSDSMPQPLRNQAWSDPEADVFFLHPTTFTAPSDTLTDNARIDDPFINRKTDYSTILYQASVFNGQCRVFAPRYRQAHLRMYYLPDTARANRAFHIAYEDIRKAFLWYLQNENGGRPIIIASHSQGTTHAKQLLKEFFDGDKNLRDRLVCAYLLGIPVEKAYYEHLSPCEDSAATGCFVAWRTYRKGYQDQYISSKDSTIAVINPYTWNPGKEKQDKSLHQGAVLYKFNKIYRHTQSAAISGNALWISKPRFPGGFFYFTRNYHAGDYNLFYMDIRNNVTRRLNAYQAKHGSSQSPQ